MKDKVHIGKDEQVQLQQIYHRLNAAGIDIKDPRNVILALDSEIQHYMSVIDAIGTKDPAPSKPRIVCDWDTCPAPQLGQLMCEINDCGYKFVNATQENGIYTVFWERPIHG